MANKTYYCNQCVIVFDPRGQDTSCPHCGGHDISEAHPCEVCGDYDKLTDVMEDGELARMCGACRESTMICNSGEMLCCTNCQIIFTPKGISTSCPYCGKENLDKVRRCDMCGSYISMSEDGTLKRRCDKCTAKQHGKANMENHKLNIGDWYRIDQKPYHYYQFIGYESNTKDFVMRRAGAMDHSPTIFPAGTEHKFIPASLKPDLRNIKEGDVVYHVQAGYTEITGVDNGCLFEFTCYGICEKYTKTGMCQFAGYCNPTVFQDHHQARAYFIEKFNEMDKEEEKNEL